MKRTLSLVLVLVLCIGLCACTSGNTEDTVPTGTAEPQVETTEETKEVLTAESVAGTYKTTMWFLDETITLNGNTTYTSSNGSKGTFSVTPNGIITLDPVDSSSADRVFQYSENTLIDYKDWVFEEDDEFGLVFSPDENGLTEQTFQDCLINGRMPGSKHNWFALLLKKDGTFELRQGYRGYSSLDIKDKFNGTYTSTGSNLVLTYEGQEYTMLIANNRFIQFHILEKVG